MGLDWAGIGDEIAQIGLPILGAVLPIPGGAAIGSALAAAIHAPSSAPVDILATLKGSAEAVQAAKEFEARHEETLLRIQVDAEVAQVTAVNTTLQADSRGASWLQRNHHAIESLWVVAMVSAIYVALPYLKIPVPEVPGNVWIMLGAILGVTAWQHGATAIENVRAGNTK